MATPNTRPILKRVFEDEQSFASTLVVALVDDMESVEWFDWDPDALKAEIRDRFDAHIPQANMDKIQALVLAMTTNQFYVSLEAFIGICNSLGGDGADFRTFDPADMEEMAWSVVEVLLNDSAPEQPLDEVFSQEIRSYIGTEAAREGFHELPKPLSFAEIDPGYQQAAESLQDPTMFTAYFSQGKELATALQDEVQQKLRLLVQQISQLPLLHGDPDTWKQFSGRGLTLIGRPQP